MGARSLVTPEAPSLVMTPDELREMWNAVELARARRKHEEGLWQTLLDGYLPPKDNHADSINSNIHFRNVESKKAQLFFQLPELQLTPLEPIQGLPGPDGQPLDGYTLIATKRAVLNKLLGRDHANVMQMINEVEFDMLATSGVAFTKICYEADFMPQEQQVPVGTMPMPGSVLGLQPPIPQMAPQMIEVPINERWRWYRFSPFKGLIPHDWFSTRYDEAPWLGMEFNLPLKEAIRRKLVPKGTEGNAQTDEQRFTHHGDQDKAIIGPRVCGVEIWRRAVQFREDAFHSELLDYLVLIEGNKEQPAVYKPSPYQTLGPDGRLTADSMIGNPIHPFALRDLSDAAWIPSDSAFTNPLVKQMNTWRAQDIKLRDSNLARFFYNEDIKEQVDKLQDLDAGQGVPVPNDLMMRGKDALVTPVPHLERAQADIHGEGSIRRDIDETLAIGSNQAGNVNKKVLSATEVAMAQQNANTRLQKERTVLIERYLCGVRKFDSLIQRYADAQDYVEIVGQTGAMKLQAWNKDVIAGRFAFDARPDSQLSSDAAAKRKDVLEYVNFMAKSPHTNQGEMARVVALEFGHDPARMVTEPTPPGPPPPNVSVRVTMEDLAGPAGAATLKILQQAGYQLTEDDLVVAQANQAVILAQEAAAQEATKEHGGAADKSDLVNKHNADHTGNMPGRVPEGAPPQQSMPEMVQ
jgi:hypothetical protein